MAYLFCTSKMLQIHTESSRSCSKIPRCSVLEKNPNIDTETVREAMVRMFNIVGISQEMPKDLGTPFFSAVIKEVSRL